MVALYDSISKLLSFPLPIGLVSSPSLCEMWEGQDGNMRGAHVLKCRGSTRRRLVLKVRQSERPKLQNYIRLWLVLQEEDEAFSPLHSRKGRKVTSLPCNTI